MSKLVSLIVAGSLAIPTAATQEVAAPPEADSVAAKPAAAKPKLQQLQLGGKLAAPLALPDIDGEQHELSEGGGKITVVNFWATRCPIQQAWEPTLAKIVRDYEKRGVRFLMVNSNGANGEIVDRDLPEDAKPYQEIRKVLDEQELPYTVLVDADNLAADVFGARTTPDIFVFGKDDRLIYRGLIDDDMRSNPENHHLRDTLDKLLAGKELEPSATRPRGCSIKRTVTDREVEGKPERGRGRGRGRRGGRSGGERR